MKKIIFILCCALLTASCMINTRMSDEMPITVSEVLVSPENNVSRGSINMDTHKVTIIYSQDEAIKTPKRFIVGDTLEIVSKRYIREMEQIANGK